MTKIRNRALLFSLIMKFCRIT